MENIFTLSGEDKELAERNARYVEQLKDHHGFKVLLAHMQEDAHEAIHGFKTVDPTDVKKIMELQNSVWRYEGLINKIEFIYNLGDAALAEREEEGN